MPHWLQLRSVIQVHFGFCKVRPLGPKCWQRSGERLSRVGCRRREPRLVPIQNIEATFGGGFLIKRQLFLQIGFKDKGIEELFDELLFFLWAASILRNCTSSSSSLMASADLSCMVPFIRKLVVTSRALAMRFKIFEAGVTSPRSYLPTLVKCTLCSFHAVPAGIIHSFCGLLGVCQRVVAS